MGQETGHQETPDHPQEQARDWRRRAELFWKLSKLFDDLAVRTRNCAHWCDHQAAEWEALAQDGPPPG